MRGRPGSATTLDIGAGEIPALVTFATRENIGLTVVGPDDALAAGIVDVFEHAGTENFRSTGGCGAARVVEDFRQGFHAASRHPHRGIQEFC